MKQIPVHGIFTVYAVYLTVIAHALPDFPVFRQDETKYVLRPSPVSSGTGAVVLDRLGRPLRDLRISVTDRCNFRCVYCMPKQVFGKNFRFIPHSDMLSFEEITRLARLFVSMGVEKIRLTGGEPLLRRHVEMTGQTAGWAENSGWTTSRCDAHD